MFLIGSRSQQTIDDYYDASSTIATGGTAQLCIPQRKSCSHIIIVNQSTAVMYIQFGVLPGVATLTNGVVTSVSVPDVGFGFLVPPTVQFLGGGNANDLVTKGATMPDWPAPFKPAQGHAIMSGGAISSISVDYGGSGYLVPPYVRIVPDRTDPTGCGLATAAQGSLPLTASGGSYYLNGTACPTTAISILCATGGSPYTAKWMP